MGGSPYPYDWIGFVRAKKKTGIGLLVFNPLFLYLPFRGFFWGRVSHIFLENYKTDILDCGGRHALS
jgi:hypothetical protein